MTHGASSFGPDSLPFLVDSQPSDTAGDGLSAVEQSFSGEAWPSQGGGSWTATDDELVHRDHPRFYSLANDSASSGLLDAVVHQTSTDDATLNPRSLTRINTREAAYIQRPDIRTHTSPISVNDGNSRWPPELSGAPLDDATPLSRNSFPNLIDTFSVLASSNTHLPTTTTSRQARLDQHDSGAGNQLDLARRVVMSTDLDELAQGSQPAVMYSDQHMPYYLPGTTTFLADSPSEWQSHLAADSPVPSDSRTALEGLVEREDSANALRTWPAHTYQRISDRSSLPSMLRTSVAPGILNELD